MNGRAKRVNVQVRDHLGLDAKNLAHGLLALDVPVDDPGAPGTAGASLSLPVGSTVDVAPYYCTIGVAAAPVRQAR